MRDKNLTLSQFNIQLEKSLRRVPLDDWFLANHVLDSPTLLLDSERYRIIYPKDFRLLRALTILQWTFPESLHWRIWLDLDSMNFSWLNKKQKLEIQVLLCSQEFCSKYLFLTTRYSGNEIFGNFLKNDMLDLLKVLKVRRKVIRPPKRKVRRRGYQDHGSRRPDHKWLPRFDYSFSENQNEKELENLKLQRTLSRVLSILSKFNNWKEIETKT